MKQVSVALLGAGGWMGRVHTLAYRNAPFYFSSDCGVADIRWMVDESREALDRVKPIAPEAKQSTDWRDAVNDPVVDLIDICLPDQLHYPVAMAALNAGKHVFCEKPLANTSAESREMADLARKVGLITRVGHAFPRNPAYDVARDLIKSGELGEITMFKGCQHVDILADPLAPFMWRADGDLAPTGIVGDTGSHVFSFMNFLIGPVAEVMADCRIFTNRRPEVPGFNYGTVPVLTGKEKMRAVTNFDAVNMICRFENGAMGAVDFSRIAMGKKFQQTFEVFGTKGSLSYDYNEINRMKFYSHSDKIGRQGYRAIDVGPENPNYRAFLSIPNLGLGYNEQKTIEIAEVVRSVATGQPMWPTFDNGHHITRMVEACIQSSEQREWVSI